MSLSRKIAVLFFMYSFYGSVDAAEMIGEKECIAQWSANVKIQNSLYAASDFATIWELISAPNRFDRALVNTIGVLYHSKNDGTYIFTDMSAMESMVYQYALRFDDRFTQESLLNELNGKYVDVSGLYINLIKKDGVRGVNLIACASPLLVARKYPIQTQKK